MTLSLKHAFNSAKADGGDNTLVRPSNWNAEHTLTCASNVLLGLDNSAPGAVIEIPCSAAARTVLAAADVAAILVALGITVPSTGDAKFTLKATADTGWVMANDGTIGNATSNATTRANADTQSLFVLIWTNVVAADAPMFDSAGSPVVRGGSALSDYAANRQISLPKVLGRAFAAAGAGAGLTSRALGHVVGEENHTLTLAETPAHDHGGATGATQPTATVSGGVFGGTAGATVNSGATFTAVIGPSAVVVTISNHTHTIPSAGGGGAHNVMQPTTFWNVMVKL